MAELLKQAIDAVLFIKDVVLKHKGNDKGIDKICNLVSSLTDDLELLQRQDAPIIPDPGVDAAMKGLKDTLVNTKRDVEECKDMTALVQLFKAKNIAEKLDGLRRDLSANMLAAVVVTNASVHSVVQNVNQKMDQSLNMQHSLDQKADRKYDALHAALLSIEQKLGPSDPANEVAATKEKRDLGKNKGAGGASTGLTNHHSSDLDVVKELNETEASKMSLGGKGRVVAATSSANRHIKLPSGSLTIMHGEDPLYWNTSSQSFPGCAVLIKEYWLEVSGKVQTAHLSPGTRYTVYLEFKLTEFTTGLNGGQTSTLSCCGERVVDDSRVCVDPGTGSGETEGVAYPVALVDGWMEVKLAEFATKDLPLYGKEVMVDFCDKNANIMKSGIIIAGMEFRANN